MTLPEILLWQRLKSRQLAGLRFRRQHPLGEYIADFYAHDAALVIEIDGGTHAGDRHDHDARRDDWMRARRLHVLRFTAVDVLHDIDAVLRTIEREALERVEGAESKPPPSASPPPPPSATGEDQDRAPPP